MNYRTEDVMNKRIGEYSDPSFNNQLQSNAPSSVRTGKKKQNAHSISTNQLKQGSVIIANGVNINYRQDLTKSTSTQQRSQSVLKSHTEFNHNFGIHQNTTGSMGSNSTQRAINNYITAPGSKGTTKGIGPQTLGKKHIRAKKLINIKDQMINLPANKLSQNILQIENNVSSSQENNPYKVDSFKITSNDFNQKGVSRHNNSLGIQQQINPADSPLRNGKSATLNQQFDQSDLNHLAIGQKKSVGINSSTILTDKPKVQRDFGNSLGVSEVNLSGSQQQNLKSLPNGDPEGGNNMSQQLMMKMSAGQGVNII